MHYAQAVNSALICSGRGTEIHRVVVYVVRKCQWPLSIASRKTAVAQRYVSKLSAKISESVLPYVHGTGG